MLRERKSEVVTITGSREFVTLIDAVGAEITQTTAIDARLHEVVIGNTRRAPEIKKIVMNL